MRIPWKAPEDDDACDVIMHLNAQALHTSWSQIYAAGYE